MQFVMPFMCCAAASCHPPLHPGSPSYPTPPSLEKEKEKIKRSKCQRGAECIPLAVSRDQSPRTTCDPGTKLTTAGGHIKKFSSQN